MLRIIQLNLKWITNCSNTSVHLRKGYSSGDKEVVIISSDEKTVCLRSKLNNVVTLS